ncbi:MAG TPA: CDP-alcohol phosphatidyltransferase family protein [Chloroflexota bacterium]|jgi:CDP-diacylglycerol--glycerol-3-phosphate 3-phosphatidyltransferase|nr:CDP-alcohol phosphatidyltransferase family protein [Chloroflexota bacterium]
MFNQDVQDWVRARAIRLIRPLARAPISPNQITTIGLACAVLVAVLAGAGYLLAAGIVLALSSITDIADGALARARDICTDYGAFFDSLLDRIAEAVVGLGIIVYYVNHGHAMEGALLTYLAMCGALMVSYARARAEGLGLECSVGFMARPERVVVTVAGLVLSAPFGLWILTASLWVLVVTTFFTTGQRLWHVYKLTHPSQPTESRLRLIKKRRVAS